MVKKSVVEKLEDWSKLYHDECLKDRKLKNDFKRQLKGLTNVSGLFKWLNSDMEYWTPVGIVEIQLTDEKTSGYRNYQHARVVSDPEDRHLYMKTDCEVHSVPYYYVWQTTGCCEDDYSGYLLFPLKDGKFFKVSYCC
jgi:hypothetical protein